MMRAQAKDFKEILGQPWLEAEITAHGDGLIPWILECEKNGGGHRLMVAPEHKES